MKEKMIAYRERFGENFPFMMVMGLSDDEIIKIIDDCLESGTPYKPDDENEDTLF